jgi:hypothetical protein
MALLAIEIPEHRRIVAVAIVGNADFLGTGFKFVGMFEVMTAGHRNARQIALHIGHEHRHTLSRKLLGQGLQSHGLAGAGGPRDQPVAVGPAEQQVLALPVRGKADEDVFHVLGVPSELSCAESS